MEVWKSLSGIVESGDNYEVSNTGLVRSIRTGKALKPDKSGAGYYRVTLSYKAYVKRYAVHRLVALAYIQQVVGKNQVNHKDGVKGNNTAGNLEWCTQTENIQHSFKTGLNTTKCEHLRIPVTQYSSDNKPIKTYVSAHEASRQTGIPQVTISQQCRKKYNSSVHNCYFRFQNAN